MAESNNTNNNPIEIDAVPGTPITLPDGFSVDEGDVVRSGDDLILIGDNGQELVINDYFSLANPPVIVASNGAQYTGQQVIGLAVDAPPAVTDQNPPGGPAENEDGEEGQEIETASGPEGEDNGGEEEPEGENEDLNDFETAAGEEEDTDPGVPSLDAIQVVSATQAAEEQNGSNAANDAAGNQNNSKPAVQEADNQENSDDENSNDGDESGSGDPVVRSNVAPEADQDIAFLNGGNTTTGNVLANDGDSDGGTLSLTEITFEGTVYSFALDGASDAGGNYVAVNGSSGSLKIYDDGNYEYTKNFGGADAGVSTTAGGRNKSVADWADGGVAIAAFNFGTDFTDADGRFDASLADGTVTSSLFGAGVAGTQGNAGSSNEIAYDPLTGETEALALSFNNEITEAKITLLRLTATEDTTGEEGNWFAYDGDGNLVGQGHIDANSVTYLNSLISEINIDTGGIAFQSLVFTGAGYDSGSTAGGGDYYVYDATYTAAPDGTESDIADTFGYTVSDGTDTAQAELTILEEGVVVPTATDVPTVLVESTEGETLDVTALGAVQAWGNSGDDVLDATGSTSTVYLYGGDGNDTLIGGSANDHLFGGDGIDTFVQAADAGTDTIFDFAFGDILIFLGGGFDAAGFTVEQAGDNTVISFAGDDENAYILHDVDAAIFDDYTASVNDEGNLEIAAAAVA